MLYLNDYYNNFEDVCNKLDGIKVYTDFPSLKSRSIEFNDSLNQLKIILNKLIKSYGKAVEFEKLKDTILTYEKRLEILKALNKMQICNGDYNQENMFTNLKGSNILNLITRIKQISVSKRIKLKIFCLTLWKEKAV
jgi:hypothetical protein